MSPARPLGADRRALRALVAVLSILFLAGIPVVTFLIWSAYQDAIRNAESRTLDYAAILEARLDASLRRADADLWKLSKTIPVAALSPKAVARYARELDADLDLHLFQFKELAGLRVADRHGDTLYTSASASTPRVNISDRDYFRQLRDNPQAGPIFSEVVIGRSTGRSVMAIARALTDTHGDFVGVVYGLLELEHFQSLFKALTVAPRSVTAFRRSDNHKLVVRWPHLAIEVNQPLHPQHPVVERMGAGTRIATVQLTAQTDGVQRIFSFQALESYPFYVIFGLSRDEILAEWRMRSLAIGAVVLLLAGMLALLLLRLWHGVRREETMIAELNESESRFRTMLDGMLEGCRIVGFDWRYRYLNDAALRHDRQSREAFMGKTMMECRPGITETEIFALEKTCMEQRTTQRAERQLTFPDGSTGWFRLIIQPVPEGIAIYSDDITERKQAEQALLRMETELTEAQEMAHIGSWYWDAMTGATTGSAEILRIYGVASTTERLPTFKEQRGLNYSVETWEQLRAAAQTTIETGVGYALDVKVLRAGGSSIWVTARGVVVRDAENRIVGMRGTVQDINERKRAEEELRLLNHGLESIVAARTAELKRLNETLVIKEEETRSVIQHMVDCVITIDEKGTIQSANPMLERIFGYTLDEVLGQNVSMLMPEPQRGAHDGHIERYRRTGQAHVIGIGREVAGLHKNGEHIALDLAISEYVTHGQRFFTGILRDIRERVHIMKELEQARLEAERANLAKSNFLAVMSHEIRTPMNGVIGMVDVLHQSSLESHQVEIVDTIRDSAYSLLGIIEDILDFSKIEAGKLEVERAPMSLADLMAQVCNMLDHLAASKDVELTLFTDPAIPTEVLGDALRLRQVLVNLVNNAIKFSSGGPRPGKVSLRARLVGQDSERATVEFQVADNGIGMDPETQARLFTSFSQADVSTTRRFGGTGLGLVISSQLVAIMGGEIEVHSAPDHGSRFTARLPFAPMPARPDSAEAAAQIAGLSCVVVGSPGGLADDLAAYLTHGGAAAARAPDLRAARQMAGAAGRSVWVIDAGDALLSVDELRLAAGDHPDRRTRFVLIGRGHRREPRVAASDLVVLDGNVLGRQTFLRAVAIAAGRAEAEAETPVASTEAAAGPPSREHARRQGRLVLIAEDNKTNQKVILRQLGLFGVAADIAGNGREALERWRSGDYALLLTDLHMPQMDGYELAAAIRGEESATRHTPIVAASANALAGEAERCRAAGIDDYLSKPVPLAKLKVILERWLPIAPDPVPDHPPTPAPRAPHAATELALDVNVLKALVGDDAVVVREFLYEFRASAQRSAAELRAACRLGQATAASVAAHRLKSAARTVGAIILGERCDQIEHAGKAGDKDTLAALLPGFEQDLAAVEACLDSLL